MVVAFATKQSSNEGRTVKVDDLNMLVPAKRDGWDYRLGNSESVAQMVLLPMIICDGYACAQQNVKLISVGHLHHLFDLLTNV